MSTCVTSEVEYFYNVFNTFFFFFSLGMIRKPEKCVCVGIFFYNFFRFLHVLFSIPLFSLGTEKDRECLRSVKMCNSCFQCSGNFIYMRLILVLNEKMSAEEND